MKSLACVFPGPACNLGVRADFALSHGSRRSWTTVVPVRYAQCSRLNEVFVLVFKFIPWRVLMSYLWALARVLTYDHLGYLGRDLSR
jgi:hypothetical protein